MSNRSDSAPLRVLTLNVHKGFGPFKRRFVLAKQREALLEQDSDLVFLQEVAADCSGTAQIAAGRCVYMADGGWIDHAWACNVVIGDEEHGNAILSRFPIVAWKNHRVHCAGDEPRGLLHCVVDLPQGREPLHAVCVHLGLREAHRRKQLAALRELVLRGVPPSSPLVVAGDFNDWRARADRGLSDTGLIDALAGDGRRVANSFPSWLPVLRLDRIYARHATATSGIQLPRRAWSPLSDHLPLAAEIRF